MKKQGIMYNLFSKILKLFLEQYEKKEDDFDIIIQKK